MDKILKKNVNTDEMKKNVNTYLYSLKKINWWNELWVVDYKDGENREETIRVTLKKMFFYLVFLTIATTVLLEMVPPLAYTFTTAVEAQFVGTDFNSSSSKGAIKFKDIRNHADFWAFMFSVAIPNIYTTKWYSHTSPVANTTEDDSKFLYENSLLGLPRLRKLKVKAEKCNTYENFKELFDECYGLYSAYTACKDDFKIPGNISDYFKYPEEEKEVAKNKTRRTSGEITNTGTTSNDITNTGKKSKDSNTENNSNPIYKNITCFKYSKQGTSFKYYGSVSTYDSGGYVQNLDKALNNTKAIMLYLYAIWNVDRSIRAVFLDFTFYNANLNIFCICKLVFEMPPSGGFATSSSFETISIMRYKNPHDFVILGLEFVYICYIIFYICQEIQNNNYYKWRYFKFFWTYVNLFIIIGSIILIPFNAYKFLIIPKKIKELDANPDQFADMDYLVYWQSVVNVIESLLLFIMWIKIFRFLNISRTMGQLAGTLRRCVKDMFVFSFLFFIVFFGFAQMGYLLFGEQIDHFNTFGTSLMTLLLTILGDFDYYAIEKHNKILAPIFFTTFIFLVFFILFNMFLAIITDTFIYVKNEIKAKRSELELSEFLLRLPTNLAIKLCPKYAPRRKIKLKLSGNEMISKIRRILELSNFSSFDIKLFFQMYNINENKTIDDQLVINMLKEVKKYKLKTDEDIFKPEDKLSIESFSRQQDRIEYLQVHISKANEILEQFAEKYRKSLN